jgi:hypothetical protein
MVDGGRSTPGLLWQRSEPKFQAETLIDKYEPGIPATVA